MEMATSGKSLSDELEAMFCHPYCDIKYVMMR